MILSILALSCLTSCGAITKATIRNGATGVSTSVTISTNNPTDWTVSPDVKLKSKDYEKE